MKKTLPVLVLLLFSVPIYGQQLIDRVPFRLIHELIFIELKVNDRHEPLNFMFDTGAGVTVIDSKFLNQYELAISGTTNIGTSGVRVQLPESFPNTLSSGQATTLDSISLYVMDLSHISQYLGFSVDGIIGIDLLKKFILETNIDNRELRLYSHENYSYAGIATPIPIEDLESGHFGIPIEIVPKRGDEPIRLVVKIDTGADNHLTFHNETLTRFNLINPRKKYKIREGFGADSTLTQNLRGKVKFALLGTKRWRNIPAIFEIDPVNRISKREADGLIGQEMLLDFNITYNLMDRVVYFKKR
jgi:hypothetical protein